MLARTYVFDVIGSDVWHQMAGVSSCAGDGVTSAIFIPFLRLDEAKTRLALLPRNCSQEGRPDISGAARWLCAVTKFRASACGSDRPEFGSMVRRQNVRGGRGR